MAETIGDRIRRIRGDLSQVEFAARLRVDKNTVGRYERGERTPDGDFLVGVQLVFGASIDWLLTGKGDSQPDFVARRPDGSVLIIEAKSPMRAEIDPDLYGRVTEAVSTAYKECGYSTPLHQIAAEAARIAADLSGPDVTIEERPGAIKGAVAQLRRRLREAIADPTSDAAGKRQA